MKKILFFIFFIFTACAQNTIENDFSVSDNMSLNEFKVKLEEYANNNPYPKIDE